jgi:hypothetical protein
MSRRTAWWLACVAVMLIVCYALRFPVAIPFILFTGWEPVAS